MKKRSHKVLPAIDKAFWYSSSSTPLEPWFVSYSLLVPGAERFIVGSCLAYTKHPDISDKLKSDLYLCFYQEQQHALAGDEFQKLGEQNLHGFYILRHICEFLNYKILNRVPGTNWKVAVASAMEQMNSSISTYGLNHSTNISQNQAFVSNSVWHFVEELEHKEVIFDLQQTLKLGLISRILAGLLVFSSFCFWISLGGLCVAINKSFKDKPPTYSLKSTAVQWVEINLSMFEGLLRYWKKDFHPRQETLPMEWNQIKAAY